MFARKTSVVVVVVIALLVIKTVTLLILGAVSFIRHTNEGHGICANGTRAGCRPDRSQSGETGLELLTSSESRT